MSCSHWGQEVDGFETWPYHGEIDRNTGLTIGAPVYYIENSRKRNRSNEDEDSQDSSTDSHAYSHGGDVVQTTWGI